MMGFIFHRVAVGVGMMKKSELMRDGSLPITQSCIHTRACTQTHTHARTHPHPHTYTHTPTHTHTPTPTHTHTYPPTHTHTHTHTHTVNSLSTICQINNHRKPGQCVVYPFFLNSGILNCYNFP